ncbi:MAG: ABC transporter permease, partial [bacterium]|nr:ABC transporter permease [bacterium]
MMNTTNKRKPPGSAEKILRILYPDESGFYTYLGDIEEAFNEKTAKGQILYAQIWYWCVVLASLPSFTMNTFFGSAAMIKNYFKIIYRNMLKQKLYSIINITGLAIGITCCIFILAYLNYELSYDKYHINADNIYRVGSTGNFGGTDFVNSTSSPVVGLALNQDMPEVLNFARIQRFGRIPVEYGEKRFYISGIFYADQSLLDIFSFEMVKGDRTTALANPNTAVITEEMAERYFGDEDPLDKVIEISDNSYFTVTGVMKNVPENSHFLFNMLLSFETMLSQRPESFTTATPNWGRWTNYTYILLKEGYDYRILDNKINEWAQQYVGPIKDQANII